MIDLKNLRKNYERQAGKQDFVKEAMKKAKYDLASLREEMIVIEKAQGVLQTVAQATQEELEYHVSEIVSLALEAVFPDPYKLNLNFELRRNKSEADLTFSKKKGEKIDPLTASGGGAVDVASFGLRVSLHSLQSPRTRSTIVLDEPFRFLSKGLQERASAMVKEISQRLGVQFIIVTHEANLLEAADKVFEVENVKRISKVKND